MKDLGPINILRIPLHTLWESPNIIARIQTEPQQLEIGFVKWFVRYDADVQESIIKQLDWALANSTYDFQSILKNVKTSNEDILKYFAFIRTVFVTQQNQTLPAQ